IYSDGVTEAADEEFNAYGEERLYKIIQANKHLSAKELIYIILDDVIKYSKNGQYSDDKTLVIIKRIK
ncbi:MAG TPA: SpoIIE family protein phosphatase, partial [Ignavibacteriaceae bacterium]|nr:SpoIIE family protein phosphatase [Ignavibacteriaceae bacterium]